MILLRVPLSLSPLYFITCHPDSAPTPSLWFPFAFALFRSILSSFEFFRPFHSPPLQRIVTIRSIPPIFDPLRFFSFILLVLCRFAPSFSFSSFQAFFRRDLGDSIHFSPLYALSSFFVYFEFSICWIFNKILRVPSFIVPFSRFFHIVLSLRYLL